MNEQKIEESRSKHDERYTAIDVMMVTESANGGSHGCTHVQFQDGFTFCSQKRMKFGRGIWHRIP